MPSPLAHSALNLFQVRVDVDISDLLNVVYNIVIS